MTRTEKIETLMKSCGLTEKSAAGLLESADWDLQRAANMLDKIENGDIPRAHIYEETRQNTSNEAFEGVVDDIADVVKKVARVVKSEIEKNQRRSR